jgi:cysteine desulfurase
MNLPVYLDYCASAPIDDRVLQEMVRCYAEVPGNSDSRTHIFGTKAKEELESGRRRLAEHLDVDKSEVLFTSGATESDNMALAGFRRFGIDSGRRHVLVSCIEHKAVLEAARRLALDGFLIEEIPVGSSGRIGVEDVLARLRPDTLLVSVMHVNNETGVIQPIEDIGRELDIKGVFFHIDAAQSFGKLNDSIRSTKYDLLSLSAHKISGPQGVGALVLKRKNYERPPIEPLFFGGKQEYGFRPGTLPVALVAGFAKAASIAENEHGLWTKNCLRIRSNLLEAVDGLDYLINGDPEHCLPSILNVSFKGVDSESVFASVKANYALSNGSACNSGSYARSHVLTSMGLAESRIDEALRLSWGTRTVVDFKLLSDYVKSVSHG